MSSGFGSRSWLLLLLLIINSSSLLLTIKQAQENVGLVVWPNGPVTTSHLPDYLVKRELLIASLLLLSFPAGGGWGTRRLTTFYMSNNAIWHPSRTFISLTTLTEHINLNKIKCQTKLCSTRINVILYQVCLIHTSEPRPSWLIQVCLIWTLPDATSILFCPLSNGWLDV